MEDRTSPNNPAYRCPRCGENSCDCLACFYCGFLYPEDELNEESACPKCSEQRDAIFNTCYICSGNAGVPLVEIPWECDGTHACPACVVKELGRIRTSYDSLVHAYEAEFGLRNKLQVENKRLKERLGRKENKCQ